MSRTPVAPITARRIMDVFARATGLSSDEPPDRYLWTDAFAVCNYLGLHLETGEDRYLTLARELVDQVHRVLGRHRPDDSRSGWISGLSREEGARHPTAGGLRIGKPLPERGPDESYDPRKEWDRDGQYYHYLTKWMHALNRVWQVTGDGTYHRWAVELARAAHQGFVISVGGERRLYWKMSIDLSRLVVPSIGAHDPLDGLLTLGELQAATPAGREGALETARRELREMCRELRWVTDDPLGAGGLMVDLYRWARLAVGADLDDRALWEGLLSDAVDSLGAVAGSNVFRRPPESRLAFRELGLSIGLAAGGRLLEALVEGGRADAIPLPDEARSRIRAHLPLRSQIEEFWRDPEHREAETWTEHREISRVMLATSLAPEGYLGSSGPGGS